MSETLTATDLFCGAGGSSLGLEAAGVELRMAANHWALAVESHAANFLRASGNHLGLVVPYRGKGISTTTDQPLPTQDTRDRFALVLKNYGDGSDPSMAHSPRDPLGAVTTQDHHSVVEMDRVPVSVEDCGFRMLEPHEIKAAMAFPVAYIIKGNKRDQVRQAGNAVTPPAMTMLVAAAVETLA